MSGQAPGGPEPLRGRFSCADQARRRADPLAATAPPHAGWLLVVHQGPWAPDALLGALGTVLASALYARAHEEGLRVLAVRRPVARGTAPPDESGRWVVADRHGLRGGTVRAPRELLDAPFAGGGPVPGPLYLVCCHGRHDPCCARYGRPVARVLADARPGAVWECSHLGGDRFAANVLVLPTGDLYGYVDTGDVPRLVAATEAGAVLVDRWRGPSRPPAEQEALRVLVLAGVDAQALRTAAVTSAPDGARTVVTVTVEGTAYAVGVESTLADPQRLTCRATHRSRARLLHARPLS